MPGTLTGRLNGRDRDRDQPSAQGKKIPEKFRCTLSERGERALGLRTASGSTIGGARTQVRARTTRERGRAGAWASGRAASRVRIRQRPLQGQLHTHTYRHRRLWDWIDYLSIFRVKNEVSVAKIASIILSIFRVKTIDYRFRFLE